MFVCLCLCLLCSYIFLSVFCVSEYICLFECLLSIFVCMYVCLRMIPCKDVCMYDMLVHMCTCLCARVPASSCVRVYVIFCIEVISFAFELVTALC